MGDLTPERIEELKRIARNFRRGTAALAPSAKATSEFRKTFTSDLTLELLAEVERLQYANENAAVCQKHIPEFTGSECVVCALEEEAERAEKAEAELVTRGDYVNDKLRERAEKAETELARVREAAKSKVVAWNEQAEAYSHHRDYQASAATLRACASQLRQAIETD